MSGYGTFATWQGTGRKATLGPGTDIFARVRLSPLMSSRRSPTGKVGAGDWSGESANPHPLATGPSTTLRASTRSRAESHDPPLQLLKRILKSPLLGPVALSHRIGEGERQRIAVVGRGEPALRADLR
jgi:hypothetical protein